MLRTDGREIARGLINYSADEARRIMRLPSKQIEAVLGYGRTGIDPSRQSGFTVNSREINKESMKTLHWMIAGGDIAGGSVFAAGAEPGQWEFSVKTEVEGMPPSQHPLVLKMCRCQGCWQSAASLPMVPGATPEGCTSGEPKQQGGKTAYSYNCPGMPAVTATGEAPALASARSVA